MKRKFKKGTVLVIIGLFVLSVSFVISRYAPMPDMVRGLLMGIGIGLLVLPLILKKLKPEEY